MNLDTIKQLLESADQVFNFGLDAIEGNDHDAYKAALALIEGGAIQRLVIDSRDGITQVDGVLMGRGDPIHLFQFAAKTVGPRH